LEGDVDDMLGLGRLHADATFGKPNLATALRWFHAASKEGSARGYLGVARLLLDPASEVFDPAAAVPMLERAAEIGSAEAAFRLSGIFADGAYAPRDEQAAERWLQHAADRDWIPALIGLADPLTQPYATPEAFELGMAHLKRAAELGSTQAPKLLARALEGRGAAEAFGVSVREWYELAASRGDASAMVRLAAAYREADLGIAQPDPARELSWKQRALESGYQNVGMMLSVAEAHAQGSHGMAVDLARSAKWLEAAAHSGSVKGMVAIAEAYESGRGVPASPAVAMAWYDKAAERGSIRAIEALARGYASGFGVPLDPQKAYRLFRRGAAAGSTTSIRESGRALALGFGTAPDRARAADFLRRAAEAGDDEAIAELAMLNGPPPRQSVPPNISPAPRTDVSVGSNMETRGSSDGSHFAQRAEK